MYLAFLSSLVPESLFPQVVKLKQRTLLLWLQKPGPRPHLYPVLIEY